MGVDNLFYSPDGGCLGCSPGIIRLFTDVPVGRMRLKVRGGAASFPERFTGRLVDLRLKVWDGPSNGKDSRLIVALQPTGIDWVEVNIGELTSSQINIEAWSTVNGQNFTASVQVDDVSFTQYGIDDGSPKNPVIFVPGIAASVLSKGDDVIWPSKKMWNWDEMDLTVPSPVALLPTDILRNFGGTGYDPMLAVLRGEGYPEYKWNARVPCDTTQIASKPLLFPFPYDWRVSNVQSAAKLRDYVQCVQSFHPGKKINIVAHSMGGLITRRMLLEYPQTNAAIKQVITVGSPFLGAPKAIATVFQGYFLGDAGTLMDVLTRAKIKNLARGFDAIYELYPSRPLFSDPGRKSLGMSPLQLMTLTNANNNFVKDLVYSEFVAHMNSAVPASGDKGQRFHDYGGQDGWNPDATGLAYTQYVGFESKASTVAQVRVIKKVWYEQGGNLPNVVRTSSDTELVYGVGDGTVPWISAALPGGLRASGSRVIYVKGPTSAVQHAGLTNHPTVYAGIIDLMRTAVTTARRSIATTATSDLGDEDDPVEEVTPQTYLTLSGIGDFVLRDSFGNSSEPAAADEIGRIVPRTQVHPLGERSTSVLLPPGENFRIDFVSDGLPFGIASVTGPYNTSPTRATRYNDVTIPAGRQARLNVFFDDTLLLTYDRDGNGSLESWVVPTVELSGAAAADATPPLVALTRNDALLTIDASDAESGVKQVHYSVDGGPIVTAGAHAVVDVSGATRVLVFADDLAGNRSGALDYVAATTQATELTLALPSSMEVGVPVVAEATLLAGSAPVQSALVAFTFGSESLTVTTDASGVARATFTPVLAGAVTVGASFAGSPQLLASTASVQGAVQPAATTLRHTGSSRAVHGRPFLLSAALTMTRGDAGVPAVPITFNVAGRWVGAITDQNGLAAAATVMQARPGLALMTITYDGDATRRGSVTTATLDVERQPSRMTVTVGATTVAGAEVVVSARLSDPLDDAPIAGRPIRLEIAGAVATAITDDRGFASASIVLPAGASLGTVPVSAAFAGDDFVAPSVASGSTLLYEAAPFVIWGGNAERVRVGQTVTLYAPDWAKQVTAGKYDAASEFKGLVTRTAGLLSICAPDGASDGDRPCWSVKAGAGTPPATGSHIGVIVSTAIMKEGGVVFGNVAATVVVRITGDPPSQVRTGVVVAVIDDPTARIAID
jgi:pimeloyl-ACP methyl ester carboxylesterase